MLTLSISNQRNREIININSDNKQELRSIDAIEPDAIYYNVPEIFFDRRLATISKESELMNKLVYMFFEEVTNKAEEQTSIEYCFNNLCNGIESILANINNDDTFADIVDNINKQINIDAKYSYRNIAKAMHTITLVDDENTLNEFSVDVELPSGTIDCTTEEDLNKKRENSEDE